MRGPPLPGGARAGAAGAQDAAGLSDEALDAWILARLAAVGVDLSVLPEADDTAPADRARILASARAFLRSTPPEIAALEMDALGPPPALYPADLGTRSRD